VRGVCRFRGRIAGSEEPAPNKTTKAMRHRFRDCVARFVVFDIGGNKYRLTAAIHVNRQKVFLRHVLTHADQGKWKDN
jgi:mRNA-degrading endonuclease HigB of HigAB toxin-antitoxin module